MTVTRKSRMNRIYITGKVDEIHELLSDFRARHDSHGYWLPLYQESQLRAALEAEGAYQSERAAELAAWETAKAAIPADYRSRHGSMLGGDVVMDGEVITEPALDTRMLPWTRVASYERRVRDLSGQSLIGGRVRDSQTLYVGQSADGRPIYRIASSHSFGDDLRETYYLPPDLWERLMLTEVRMRGITPEKARAWLEEYRGCVGTELYEFAAERKCLTSTS